MNLVGSLKFQKPIIKYFFNMQYFKILEPKVFFYYENFQKLESKGALNLSLKK